MDDVDMLAAKVIAQALREQWPITPERMEKWTAALDVLMDHPDGRIRARAIEVAGRLKEQLLKSAEIAVKLREVAAVERATALLDGVSRPTEGDTVSSEQNLCSARNSDSNEVIPLGDTGEFPATVAGEPAETPAAATEFGGGEAVDVAEVVEDVDLPGGDRSNLGL